MKNKLTFIFAIVLSVIALGVIAGVSFAYFSDMNTDSVLITAGNVNVTLVETFPDSDEYGAETDDKTFKVVSEGNKRTYVRACIYTIVEYYDSGDWIAYAVNQDDITYTINAPNWVYSNGYYYYKNILYPPTNHQTTDFEITNVRIDSLPDELEGKSVRYNMSVKVEGSQATHGAYLKNFNISALPAGVEVLS
jgi:SipW-cognate class signal peptide